LWLVPKKSEKRYNKYIMANKAHQAEIDYAAKAEALQKSTRSIEDEKMAKRLAREEKNFYKEVAKKNKARERWVAPLLLILTILISFLIYFSNFSRF
jgi:hypothetical protein